MRKIIVWTLYLLSIFIPLTFTIYNSELFEFPKFILLLSGTLVITIAWAIHIAVSHDWKVWRSDTPSTLRFMHWSILAVLATQTLATIFSINPYTSFWGYYSRFHQGLLTTICYTIIYFAAVKWLDKKSTHKIIKISIGTAFLVSMYAITERFGIDKSLWVQDVVNRPFSTLGQPNWLAAYVIPNYFLALYISHKNLRKVNDSLLHYVVPAVLLAALYLSKSRSGLLGFALAYVAYIALLIRNFSWESMRAYIIHHTLLIVIVPIVTGTVATPSLFALIKKDLTPPPPAVVAGNTALEEGGTESGTIRKIVWTGALKLIEEHPILGTGPETFAYTYYWVRPLSHNMTSEWDFLYNKAHNEYLNIAAGAGLVGLAAYLWWHLACAAVAFTKIAKSKKVRQEDGDARRTYYPILLAAIIGFFVTNFFGFSVIPVYFVMTVLAALGSTVAKELDANDLSTEGAYTFTHYAVLFTLSAVALSWPIRLYLADLDYAKGKAYLDANIVGTAIPLLSRAVADRPAEPLFHSALGEAYATVALAAAESKNDLVKATTQKYEDLALQEALLTKEENPWHLNYYKSRAKIYLTLATYKPSYNNQAYDELKKARELAPTDPKLAYNLGLLDTRLGNLTGAEGQLQDAISLKPDYEEPYYALTLLYEQTKQADKIPALLKDAKSHLATYSAQLKEKINKYAN